MNTTLTAYAPLGNLTSSISLSAYTPRQVEGHQTYISTMDARGPVSIKMANKAQERATVKSGNSQMVGLPLSSKDMSSIRFDVMSHVFPLASLLGES